MKLTYTETERNYFIAIYTDFSYEPFNQQYYERNLESFNKILEIRKFKNDISLYCTCGVYEGSIIRMDMSNLVKIIEDFTINKWNKKISYKHKFKENNKTIDVFNGSKWVFLPNYDGPDKFSYIPSESKSKFLDAFGRELKVGDMVITTSRNDIGAGFIKEIKKTGGVIIDLFTPIGYHNESKEKTMLYDREFSINKRKCIVVNNNLYDDLFVHKLKINT